MCARGLGCARPAAAPTTPWPQGGPWPGLGLGQSRVPTAATAGQRLGLLGHRLGRPRPRGGSTVVWGRRWRLLLLAGPRAIGRAQSQPCGPGERGPGGGRGGSSTAGLRGSDSSSPGAAASAAAAARRAGS